MTHPNDARNDARIGRNDRARGAPNRSTLGATGGANGAVTPAACAPHGDAQNRPPTDDGVRLDVGKAHAERPCAVCGEPIVERGERAIYCSTRCCWRAWRNRQGAIERTCLVCEETFTTEGDDKICSDDCRLLWPAIRDERRRAKRGAS